MRRTRQTVTFNALDFMQLGVMYGYNYAKNEQETQTVLESPVVVSATNIEPIETLFGRYDNNPRWANFTTWLRERRDQINEIEREREVAHLV